MTPQEKALVKNSWTRIVPIADKAAELFYRRLFELDPALKPLFKHDMQVQGAKLMKTIGLAVSALDNLEPLKESLKDLGANHVVYGVKDEDYNTVASALLWTLEQGLGHAFNEEVKAAWTTTYTTLADVMKAGAADARAH